MDVIIGTHWTSSSPHGTSQEAYRVAAELFSVELAKLRAVIAPISPRWRRRQKPAGAPWTPGAVAELAAGLAAETTGPDTGARRAARRGASSVVSRIRGDDVNATEPQQSGRQLVPVHGVLGLCDRSVQSFCAGIARQCSLSPPYRARPRRDRGRHPRSRAPTAWCWYATRRARRAVLVRITAAFLPWESWGASGACLWLRIVPRPLRDAFYVHHAKRRYRCFGKFDSCRLPAPGQLRGSCLEPQVSDCTRRCRRLCWLQGLSLIP